MDPQQREAVSTERAVADLATILGITTFSNASTIAMATVLKHQRKVVAALEYETADPDADQVANQSADEWAPGKRKAIGVDSVGAQPYGEEPAAEEEENQDPDADQVANQSADEWAPEKRKVKGHQQKAKKKKTGFTNKGRLAFKSEGGVLATGQARTCLPDALYVLLPSLLVLAPDLDTVRTAIMGTELFKDALFTTAQTYVQTLGLRLSCITKDFCLKGGPAYHVFNTTGRFLVVHLLVSFGAHDKEPDDHCVAYDGVTVRDNNQYKKVKQLDDGDRASPENARKVFDSLYPNMMVRVKNVYELLA